MKTQTKIVKEAVKIGGEIMLKAIPTEGIVVKDGRVNFATAADLASEKAIIEHIKKHFSHDAILSEETQSDLPDLMQQERLWVIDPIDGTNNFRYGRKFCGVSVGYVEKGVIQCGAIYNPFQKELFFAEKDHGAFCNDALIRISGQDVMGQATISFENAYDQQVSRKNFENILKLLSFPWVLVRGSAVLSLADLACGRIDLYYNRNAKPWDNAAAFLLVTEAGGIVKTLTGEEATFVSPDIVAGNKQLVDTFLQAAKD